MSLALGAQATGGRRRLSTRGSSQQMRPADQVPMGDREGEGEAQLHRDAASEALS